MIRRANYLLLFSLICIVWTSSPASAEQTWKAGVARSVITPSTPVWLAGYGTKRAPDGKIHDLWAKALALEDPRGRRAVLITSDFQGVPKGMSDRVFARLKSRFKLDRHQVMLTFSHNHCGPRLGDDLVDYYPIDEAQVKLVAQYTDRMVDLCVELVGRSLDKLSPATLHQGSGRTPFAVNRRNNPESRVPQMRKQGIPLRGPVDHAVPVLTVTRPGGKLEAILFGYACHPTTLSFRTWNGDYPGFAQVALEKNHPGATAMFVNTCGGDQNPLPRRRVELCRKYGEMLASAVEKALTGKLSSVSPGLRTEFEIVNLPYQRVIQRDELVALQSDRNAIKARWARRLLGKLAEGERFSPTYPYPVHVWRLGDEMLMIGTGAETVVDYALRFKREFGAGTWVCGYADDMIAYIPSRRVWEEGGYEGGARLYEYGRPALRWGDDVEDRIAASVHKLAGRVGRTPSQKIAGKTSLWNGFRRTDFKLNGFACRVVFPKKAAPGKPWIWRARFWGHEPQTDVALLKRGFHVCYCDVADLWGNTEAISRWGQFYAFVTKEHGFSTRPALEGMSRGGLIIYAWAIQHPQKVSCVYGDAPAMGLRPYVRGRKEGDPSLKRVQKWMSAHNLNLAQAQKYGGDALDRFQPLVDARVPLIHVCGDADESVPFTEHTAEFAKRYRKAGGKIKVIVKKGGKHHPHSLKDPTPIVEFIVAAQKPPK